MSSHPYRSVVDVEVRYAETDQMGVVHHANYIVWLELARTELCKASGFHYAEIEKLGYLLIVTRVETRYAKPARYGDTVRIHCWLDRLGSRGLRFAYQVSRGEDTLATGATEHIWVDSSTGKPCRTPAVLLQPFTDLARPEAAEGASEAR